MVIRKKDSTTETIEQIKLPKWLDNLITKKWFLYLMVAVMFVLFVGFSLPANTRAELINNIFAKGPPSGDQVKIPPVVTGTATPHPTPKATEGAATPTGQEKNQINIDRNDPVLAQRIKYLEMGGKVLIPIANPPQEIQIGSSSVYITSLAINSKVSGFIENRGNKALHVNTGKITFIAKDYLFTTELPVIYINGENGASAALWFEAGQKKSFSTINTKDIDGYKKLGGIPEDLKKIDQLVTQSSYIQINGFSISDT